MNKMTLNAFGSAAAGLYVVGLIVYALTGEVLDIGWLFSALLIGIALAGIAGQVTFLSTRSNDAAANYAIIGTLLISAVVSAAVKPAPEDYDSVVEYAPRQTHTQNTSPSPRPNTGASRERLRQAQQDFVGEGINENLRITNGLNEAFMASQRMDSTTTTEDIESMIRDLAEKESLLDDFRDHLDTMNERYRRKLLNAGASSEQANQMANSFHKAQRATNRKSERMLKIWREIFELSKQTLIILRDNPEHWHYDDERKAVVFNDDATLNEYAPKQDKIQSLLDEAR